MEYSLPDTVDPPTIAGALAQVAGLRFSAARTARRTYLDTFDWRLYGKGLVAARLDDGTTPTLELTTLDGEPVCESMPVSKSARFARDLPASELRNILEPILGPRALLPTAHIESRELPSELVDAEGNLEATVLLEEPRLVVDSDHDPRGEHRLELGTWVRVSGATDHTDQRDRLTRALQRDFGLTSASEPLAIRAARATGKEPGNYSPKLRVALDPNMPASDAFGAVLGHLLETVLTNERGVRDDLDSEFLHDFRVAVRRARSLFTEGKGVIDSQARRNLRDELRWLTGMTSPVRDLDVHLLEFDRHPTAPSANTKPGGDAQPVRDFLEQRKTAAHQDLVSALDSERYRNLLAEWQSLVDGDPEGSLGAAHPDADRPILDVSNRRIWRAYRRVRKQARALGPASPPGDLHELRKTAKKLRYLLEAFHSLYPEDDIDRLIGKLKELQDVLGSYQDAVVQAEGLRQIASDMSEEGAGSAGAFTTLDSAEERLRQRRRTAREALTGNLSRFNAPDVRRLVRTLFHPSP